jgi:hypothetical protein
MGLRTIVYVSAALENARGFKIPTGLSAICQVARKNNAKNDVTGILTYSRGHYLQVIEGESDAIEQAYKNICADDRHCNVVKIFDASINDRHFSGWSMRLNSAIAREPSFQHLMRSLEDEFIELGDEERKLFSIFHKDDESNEFDLFDGKSLKLRAWPDFTKVQPTPSLIELCARLTSSSENYSNIVSSRDFGTKAQIDVMLRDLQRTGILVVSDVSLADSTNGEFREAQSFYNKMRNFLTLGSRNGLS